MSQSLDPSYTIVSLQNFFYVWSLAVMQTKALRSFAIATIPPISMLNIQQCNQSWASFDNTLGCS